MAYGANFPAMFRQAADYVMDRALRHGEARVRGTNRGMSARQWSRLFCLDVSGADHLALLLGFVGDELAEVGGRADKWCSAQVGKSGLDLGIGESGIDFLV
jgi:hypothetical protein